MLDNILEVLRALPNYAFLVVAVLLLIVLVYAIAIPEDHWLADEFPDDDAIPRASGSTRICRCSKAGISPTRTRRCSGRSGTISTGA